MVMTPSFIIRIIIIYLCSILAIAFYTLLERKILGYAQLRKGPNKVGIIGLPQPFADALKLFIKEQTKPTFSNISPYILSPIITLILALLLWALYPHPYPPFFIPLGILFFISISSLNVYTTLGAG
jgi:NADH-ubiquinone oxidoreductase chain 1